VVAKVAKALARAVGKAAKAKVAKGLRRGTHEEAQPTAHLRPGETATSLEKEIVLPV
jgi:hypothetical protein